MARQQLTKLRAANVTEELLADSGSGGQLNKLQAANVNEELLADSCR